MKDMSQWNRFSVLENEDPIPNSPDSDTENTESMSESPLSSIPERVYIMSLKPKFSTHLSINLRAMDTGKRFLINALLDSGATGLFLDVKFVKYHNLNTRKLPRAIPVYNVDGTLNKGGSIYEEVDLVMDFQNHTEKATFAVCDLGDKTAIIGHTWLWLHNPDVDWKTGEVQFTRCPPECHMEVKRDQHLLHEIVEVVFY